MLAVLDRYEASNAARYEDEMECLRLRAELASIQAQRAAEAKAHEQWKRENEMDREKRRLLREQLDDERERGDFDTYDEAKRAELEEIFASTRELMASL